MTIEKIMERAAGAMSSTCPKCGALRGVRCRSTSGKRSPNAHKERAINRQEYENRWEGAVIYPQVIGGFRS